jgi:dTDP-glucose pyrophosphorylase
MTPFSEKFPKPLLPVCNRPIIEHQIEIMKSLGIREVVILIGHKGFEISKVLGDGSRLGVSVRYVEQTSTLGIAHAVGLLEPHIARPFLLFLGDIFFVPGDLKQMCELFAEQGTGAVLAAKEEPNPEAIRRNFSIALSPDGRVTRVVEKPRHTTNRLKGVGLYLFDLPIFDAIRRTPRTAMRDEYEITDAIQVLIDDGYPVRAATSILDDINLTTPADLLRCNLVQARLVPQSTLVGAHCELHADAKIEESVLGTHVRIKHPVHIARSVVFDHTCWDSPTGFEQCIVTPDFVVDCKHGVRLA